MITYNQYHQLRVRQRLLAVTCLSWRDFLGKQDLFHYADAGSLPFWCHYMSWHLGPPNIHRPHLALSFCCLLTFYSSSSPRLHLCIDCIFILIFLPFLFSLLAPSPFFKSIGSVFNFKWKKWKGRQTVCVSPQHIECSGCDTTWCDSFELLWTRIIVSSLEVTQFWNSF